MSNKEETVLVLIRCDNEVGLVKMPRTDFERYKLLITKQNDGDYESEEEELKLEKELEELSEKYNNYGEHYVDCEELWI